MKALSPKPSLSHTEMTEVITRTKAALHASHPLLKKHGNGKTPLWKQLIQFLIFCAVYCKSDRRSFYCSDINVCALAALQLIASNRGVKV